MLSAGFCMYVVVASFTPGPNNIMSMSSANRHGFRGTLPFMFGVAAGFFAVLLLSGGFQLLLRQFIPRITGWMNLLGCLYLLYLAYKIMSSKSARQGEGGNAASFWRGLLLQFVNPKGVLYALTVISTFVMPYSSSPSVLATVCLTLAVVSLLSTGSWAAFGSLYNRFLSRWEKPFQIAMGLMLVYAAISIYR